MEWDLKKSHFVLLSSFLLPVVLSHNLIHKLFTYLFPPYFPIQHPPMVFFLLLFSFFSKSFFPNHNTEEGADTPVGGGGNHEINLEFDFLIFFYIEKSIGGWIHEDEFNGFRPVIDELVK